MTTNTPSENRYFEDYCLISKYKNFYQETILKLLTSYSNRDPYYRASNAIKDAQVLMVAMGYTQPLEEESTK